MRQSDRKTTNSVLKYKIRLFTFFTQHKFQIIFIVLLCIHLFLRFYQLFQRASFGWDQVDSAWAANNILINHNFLINGPVAKGNSGIFMGPLYYYAITPFYFLVRMDPIASPIFQGVMSIVNLLVLYFVTKKIFNTPIALIAIFINTFCPVVLNADRWQDAYYLIVPISYLIFFALYKIITNSEKYVFLLAIFLGLSFQVDFTSVFYPILILLSLPLFPRTRKMLLYGLSSLPIFLVFLIPSILIQLGTKHSESNSLLYLFHTSYHGFHLRRVLQIAHDGFISFEQVLQFRIFRPFVFLVLPLFASVYYFLNPRRQSLFLFYLMSIWVIVPWFVLSTYSGELTDYYFSLPRDLVIAMLAYLTMVLLQRKNIIVKLTPIFFWIIYGYFGLYVFLNQPFGDLLGNEQAVRQIIFEKEKVPYQDHSPQPYIYYEYMRNHER